MRTVKVTFTDGNTIVTSINGTEQEIRDYYTKNSFNFGDNEEHPADNMQRGVTVEFLED